MTNDEMTTAVLKKLGEPPLAPVNWTRPEVLDYTVELAHVWASLTWQNQKTVTVTIPAGVGTRLRSLVNDLFVVLSARTASGKLEPIAILEAAARDEQILLSTDPPRAYHAAGDLLTLLPPTGGVVTIRYVAEAPGSAGDTMPLDREDEEVFANAVAWYARWKKGGQEIAEEMPAVGEFLDAARKKASLVRQMAATQNYDVAPLPDRWFETAAKAWVLVTRGMKKNAAGN